MTENQAAQPQAEGTSVITVTINYDMKDGSIKISHNCALQALLVGIVDMAKGKLGQTKESQIIKPGIMQKMGLRR